MTLKKDFLLYPGSTSVKDVLLTYQVQQCQWWWLLLIETEGDYKVCSFGSLLPYLTRRLAQIEHNIGDCPICSGMDPILYAETDILVQEALADTSICSQLLEDLPAADLPIIAIEEMYDVGSASWLLNIQSRVCGVTTEGLISDVSYEQMR